MTRREDLFIMRVNADERRLIDQLAAREERSASDAIRRLIRRAVQGHESASAKSEALSISRL